MTLKILQGVGAGAVVIFVLLLIPVLLRMRRAVEEVGILVAESRPQTITLLKTAQATLDGVNRELVSIEAITDETELLIGKVSDASAAVERAITSPVSKAGFVAAGVTAIGFAVRKRLFREMSGKR